MPRARSLKPALFKNEILGVADPINTILFQGLWVLADREGRLEDRPLKIHAEIVPYRKDVDTDAILQWLEETKFIIRYTAKDNQKYIQVVNFIKHQNPHRNENPSVIPPVDCGLGTTPDFIGTARALTFNLTPDSLTPLPPEGEGRFEEVVEVFKNLEGATVDYNRAKRLWISQVLNPHTDKIIDAIGHYSHIPQWQRGAIPTLANFLGDGSWKVLPKLPYGAKSGIR